ncbi:MAG: hypothetical protein Q8P67_12210 [archaeon]|nr:hypothetical protein [archaeon]
MRISVGGSASHKFLRLNFRVTSGILGECPMSTPEARAGSVGK